jgi:hypothetical protein
MRPGCGSRGLAVLALLVTVSTGARGAEELRVGFGKADITPEIKDGKPVWIAGYGHNRAAAGVHDPLWARAVVIEHGGRKIALIAVDLVGFMYPNTLGVRRRLKDFRYVLVASTHNHEGPDTIGLWGPSPRASGVDPAYLARAEERIVAAARQAEAALTPARAEYGIAEDESLVSDGRLPIVKDGVLRIVRFARPGDGRALGLLVQWNCHPESLGSQNRLITADFPYYTVAALEKKHDCPVAYFSGAVGGLLSVPEDKFQRSDGTFLRDGNYELARVYGAAVAALAESALVQAQPLPLGPISVSARTVALPMANPGYRQGRAIGVLQRQAFQWTGDPARPGPPLPDRQADGDLAIASEVAYIRLGDLHLAAIPGELYPELVHGRYQEPVEPNVDMPDAPLEPPVMKSLPGSKTMLFGLANDEVGYIIPKRQWDDVAPFAYGRTSKQYGEVNSVGPEVAPILMNALRDCVRSAEPR